MSAEARTGRVGVTPSTLTLARGEQRTLTATAYAPSGAVLSGDRLIYVSNDRSIARVDDRGGVTGLDTGRTAVRVIAKDQPSISVTVPVAVVVRTPPAVRHALYLEQGGSGRGTVAASVAGLACAIACVALVDAGTAVTVTATPAAGNAFVRWSAGCTGTVPTCAFVMDSARTVTAVIDTILPRHQVTVAVVGTGRGRVRSWPDAILCPGTCAASFVARDALVLSAEEMPGSAFAGWSGACTGTAPTCHLTVTGPRSVTATFTLTTPASSGGGTLIAFASNRDGNAEIYVMRPDGTDVRRVTSDPATDSDPVLSPDATRIAFHSNRGGTGRLYVMNVDGSGVRALNPRATGREFTASWSPDGQSIAYVSTGNPLGLFPGDEGPQTVYVVRADGTAPRPLGPGYMAAWGPTGRIAFGETNAAGKSQLFTMAADGTDVRPLTNGLTDAYTPAWSPDGRRIVYDAPDPMRGNESHLRVVNADGTGAAWISIAGTGMRGITEAAATWSPDGTRLVFMSSYGRDGLQLFTTTAAGQDLRQLTAEGRYNGLPSWR